MADKELFNQVVEALENVTQVPVKKTNKVANRGEYRFLCKQPEITMLLSCQNRLRIDLKLLPNPLSA